MNTGKDVLFLQNKRKPAATRNPNHKNTQTNNKTRRANHKYANKQNNQNPGKQTQRSCVNNGSMYNRVEKYGMKMAMGGGHMFKGKCTI